MRARTTATRVAVLEAAGVELIAKNGGGPDVRFEEGQMSITGEQVKPARALIGWSLLSSPSNQSQGNF
jgi:hypothetical protein